MRPEAHRRRRVPAATWLLGVPGFVCVALGLLLMLGIGAGLHPLLQGSGAGLVLLVSGLALVGSAAFPLVFARLAERDGDASGDGR